MADNNKSQNYSERNDASASVHTFTPVNRRKDGALFRKIRERIREGYYDSSHILKEIADRITGSRQN